MMFLLSMFNFSYFKHNELIGPSEVIAKNNTFSIEGVDAVLSVFRGVGQVYLADNYLRYPFSSLVTISGVLILVGTLVCSRISAIFMFVGSLTGVLTGT